MRVIVICVAKWLLYMQRQCLDGPINFFHSFYWSNLILCIHNVDILNICMKEFGSQKNIIDKKKL